MNIYKFITILYLKYFGIVFLGLNIFYVTIDSVFNRNLPTFINLKILFFFYSFIESINTTTSVVIVFAFILSIRKLINNNEFVALLSFGYHKKDILKPFLLISSLITITLIAINLTDLAYASQKKTTILKHQKIYNDQENIFLKHNNTYVYFKKLLPIEKKAIGVDIFEFKDGFELTKVHYAKEANFKNNFWILKNSYTITYPNKNDTGDKKLIITNENNIKTLEGFLPKIIHTIYEDNMQFSILDAVKLISIFNKQNIDTNKARSTLYTNIIVPFYSMILITILFSYAPIIGRISNMAIYSLLSFTSTLSIFGLLKMFENLSFHASGITTEILGLAPIILLCYYAVHRYIRTK